MNSSADSAINRVAVLGIGRDPFPVLRGLTDGIHTTFLCDPDELLVIGFRQALGSKRPARDPQQQQTPRGFGVPQTKHQRRARARRRSANKRRRGVKLLEQFVEVIGPDRFLHFLALHLDVRRARVATVMQQHTVAMGGDFFGQRHELIEPAAAAGDQCDKRTVVTNDLIAEIHAREYWL